MNAQRPKRGFVTGLRWWWNTRIRSLWSVWLPGKLEQNSSQRGVVAFEQTANDPTPPDEEDITAILTVYKRSEYLPQQVAALRAQTKPPKEIWVWSNQADEPLGDYSSLVDRVVVSNANWKFWGRFSIAALVRTPYISIFDDDVLPEPEWHQNCLDTFASGIDGVLGGSGVLLPESGGYSSKHKVGWNGHHREYAEAVDLVGHAWFIKRAHLQYMWAEAPHSWENGEDIHFSYMVQKHAGLGTYVPPHPESQPARWSCRPDFGKRVGRTSTATHKTAGHHGLRDEIVDTYRAAGWNIVADKDAVS